MTNASGVGVNLDYYPVNINSLPAGYTKETFFEYFRTHINTFVDASKSQFYPHPNIPNEANKWINDPLGTILLIDIPGDDGSVIVIDKQSDSWTFATIYDPVSASHHPVSGNRQFGIKENSNGTYEIFTKGVDRLTGGADQLVGMISSFFLGKPIQFSQADLLWKSMQKGLEEFINSHG